MTAEAGQTSTKNSIVNNKLNNAIASIANSIVSSTSSAPLLSGSSLRTVTTTEDQAEASVHRSPLQPVESVQQVLRSEPETFDTSIPLDTYTTSHQQALFRTHPTGYFVDDSTLSQCNSFRRIRFSGPQQTSAVNPPVDVANILHAIMPSSSSNNQASMHIEEATSLPPGSDAMDVDVDSSAKPAISCISGPAAKQAMLDSSASQSKSNSGLPCAILIGVDLSDLAFDLFLTSFLGGEPLPYKQIL